jgi:hypothetical protein
LGIGYYYVFRDLYAKLNIVRLGIYGKTGFAVIFIYYVAFGGFYLLFLTGTIIDLGFVGLYVLFLAHARRHKA